MTQVMLRSVYSSLGEINQKQKPRNPTSSVGKKESPILICLVLLEVVKGTCVLMFRSGKPAGGDGPFKTWRLSTQVVKES